MTSVNFFVDATKPNSFVYKLTEGQLMVNWGFPGGSDGKDSTCSVGDLDSIPGLGRSPGRGHDNLSIILAWRIPKD